MFRVIVRYFTTYVFCVLPVELAGMLLLPFILPFVPRGREQLPRFFRWFDNHEIHLPDNGHTDVDGLLGPTSERVKIGYFIKDQEITPEVYTYKVNPDFGFFKLIWHRYRWIGLRNPAYYFKYVVMGRKITREIDFVVKGDIEYSKDNADYFWYVGDKAGYRKGWYFTTMYHGPDKFYELYAVIPYTRTRGLRARIGYKMRNPDGLKRGEVVPFETSFTPFKKLGN